MSLLIIISVRLSSNMDSHLYLTSNRIVHRKYPTLRPPVFSLSFNMLRVGTSMSLGSLATILRLCVGGEGFTSE